MPVTASLKRHSLFQKSLFGSLASLTFAVTACADASTTDATLGNAGLADAQAASAPTETAVQTAQAPDHNSHDGHAHSAGEGHADMSTPLMLPNVDFISTEAPNEHVIGDATAPVTVIGYASVTCPHCGDWFTNEWPSFKSELIETGRVRFIFREFPTPPMQLSMAGFLIANCADESRFFESIEYQMENQEMIFESAKAGKAREAYVALAQKFGLKDEAEMNACLSNQAEVKKIQTAVERGQAGGVKGAPAFFIDETLYRGNTSFVKLKAEIDKALDTGVSKMEKGQSKK